MDNWQIAVIVVTVIGGGWGIVKGTAGIIKPLIETITKLNVNVERLSLDLKELKTGNTDSHERIWKHETAQDEKIEDHETRLQIIEKKG